MGLRIVTVDAAAGLPGRFAAAGVHQPLCALAAGPRAELQAALEDATSLEDLPGKWQAALLEAEAAAGGACPAPNGCCGAGGLR